MRSITIVQWPNTCLSIALAAAVLNMFVVSPLHAFITALFYMSLTIWGYAEATKGVNWFRHALGIAVLAYIFTRLGLSLTHT